MASPFTGQIQSFGFNFAPRDWTFCAGQLVSISEFSSLFSLLSDFYGGNARTTFGIPNLTSRTPIGFNMGGGVGLYLYPLGTMYGYQNLILHELQMPVHNHTATFVPSGGGADAVVEATTEDGESATPSAGSFLAKAVSGPSGADVDEKIYRNTTPTAGTLVDLGGVSGGGSGGGSVTLATAGASSSVNIQNPFTAINFSLCLDGTYPSRN